MARRRVRLLATIVITLVAVHMARHWLMVSAFVFCAAVMVAVWFGIAMVWPEKRRWWR